MPLGRKHLHKQFMYLLRVVAGVLGYELKLRPSNTDFGWRSDYA